MAEYNLAGTVEGDLRNQISDIYINAEALDSPSSKTKSEYQNVNWTIQYGYYKNTTDIQEVIDARARWIVGKGYIADESTQLLLDTLKGNGVDTFNSILQNMIRTMEIGGDSYAEIIRDSDDIIVNIKPLDPQKIKVKFTKKGIIEKYEQTSTKETWEPEEILHFSRNRLGDSMHGISMVDVLKIFTESKKECLQDFRKVMHWHVKPRWKHKIKEDDPVAIAAYKTLQESTKATGDDIFEPFDLVESELISVPANATLSPISWLEYLDRAFYKAAGVPQFIVGGGTGFTEASEKIAYLSWQQTVEERQLYIEEQILAQLNIVINLEFPASLENELISDNAKDGAQNIDQSELNPQSENI